MNNDFFNMLRGIIMASFLDHSDKTDMLDKLEHVENVYKKGHDYADQARKKNDN